MSEPVSTARAGACPQSILDAIPFARHLGFRVAPPDAAPALLYVPFRQGLVGNMFLPAYHGGVVGALLETVAMAMILKEEGRLPKLVDINVDYLRSAGPRDLYADCELVRVGRRVAAVTCRCWQSDPEHCVAISRAHFVLADGDSGRPLI